MSPHDIEVLLHHYCSHEPWPRSKTSAYVSTIDWMFRNGLCDRQDVYTTLTPKGTALVRMLCATPLPQQQFINPLTGDAIEDAA